MSDLIQALKELQADTVALKFKAHGYHWNVEGDDFPQWHSKFAEIYEDLDGAIDEFAEWIRMLDLGSYAPFSLSRLAELSSVSETPVEPTPEAMAADLCAALNAVTVKIVALADAATAGKQYGLANFLGDRQTMHQKWGWQLGVAAKDKSGE
jgi:starvation-inducible DNA-binding protein